MGQELADLFVTLRSVSGPLSKGFAEASVEGESFAAKTGSWKAALSKLGQGTILVGAAVAAVSVKMAADWQTSMVRLSTSAGESGGLINQKLTGNLALVSSGLLKMSRDTATSTKELASGMYMVESAGFHGAAGLTVMKAAAQGAKAEGAPLQEMAIALTSAMKSYHLGASDAVSMTNQMVATVGAGRMTMAAFSGAISTVLPIAASAGLSYAQVGGAVATLTTKTKSADIATQELAFAVRNLEAPNNIASKTMAALGLSSNDVSMHLGQRGLTGTLALLESTAKKHEGADGLIHVMLNGKETALTFDGAMKKMMGGAVGLNAALQLGGGSAKEFAANVATVAKAAQGAGKDVNGWKEITGTFNFQMGQLKQTVITYAIQLGTVLLPYVSSAIKWFTQHSTVTNVLAGVIGGVLLVAVGAYIVSMAQAAAATIAATWPILAVIAAVALVAAGLVYAYNHFKWFHDAVNKTWAGIKIGAEWLWNALQVVWDAIQTAFSATVDFLSSAWDGVKAAWSAAVTAFDATVAWFKALPGRIMTGIEAIPGLIKTAIEKAFYWWGYGLGLMVKEATALPGQIWDVLKALPGLLVSLFTSIWHVVVAVFTSMWHGIVDVTVSIYNTLISWGRSAVDGTVKFFTELPGKILAVLKALPGAIKGAVSDAGTWLLAAGKAVVTGLVNGIKNAFGSALGAVKDLGGSLVKGFSDAIGHASPAKKFIPAGMAIPEGIIQGIIASRPSAIKEVQKLGAEMVKTHSTYLESLVSKTGAVAIKLGTIYDSIGAKLKTAQSKLAQLVSDSAKLASDTASKIVDTGDLTAVQGATDAAGTQGPATAADMIANLHKSITTAQQFGQALAQLKKQGLDATSLSQIAAAGPAAGLATANALLAGGQTAITQVAQLQTQLATTATTSGQQVATAMYGSGIAAAQGLVKGLQDQEATVLAQITKMVNAMVTAVKKNLKIHSPSAVFADEVGAQIPAGIAQGITSGMPAVHASLNGIGSAGSFNVGGIPSAGPMSGILTLSTPIVVQLDGKTIWQSNQKQSVRYNGRNANNGQSLPAGR